MKKPWLDLTREEANVLYAQVLADNDVDSMRRLCLHDLFFLLTVAFRRQDANRDWLYARCREVEREPNGYLDLWAREHYKALDCETPVLTSTGWKKHIDLQPGDVVFAPNGEQVRVIANTGVMHGADCYQVGDVVCSGNHLWPHQKKRRRRAPGGRREVSYETEIVKTTDRPALRLPRIKPLRFEQEAPLPLDPYVLGVWLGDGAAASGCVTCHPEDNEILAACDVGGGVQDTDRITKTVYGLRPILRALGVLSNKHIPEEYLYATEENRLALLQGLMDTDGSASTRGGAVFVNTNERLVEGVRFLAASLGFSPRVGRYEHKTCPGSPFWQVRFQAYKSHSPFRLKRKAARCKEGNRLYGTADGPRMRSYVPSPVATRPVNCIQVEGGLYLAGKSLLPTHNSTIITYALTIQDILRDPDLTVGIFSHTRPIAKAFLKQIKTELETNTFLQGLFPDVLYANPERDSTSWSLDSGITVRRKTNPKENTVEAWGLVDGQPTSKHYRLLVYDDVVTRESVTTPDMMAKVSEAWALSLNLGAADGAVRYIGTRYHFGDCYKTMLDRNAAIPRIRPATINGAVDGAPVFLSAENLDEKRRTQGPYVFSCHGEGTLVTMADWSQKPIEQIEPGDVVVGWSHGDKNGRATLCPTKVVATSVRTADAVESVLADGSVLQHTPDHKWWTGRNNYDYSPRKEYSPLGFGQGQQKGLCRVVDLSFLQEEVDPRAVGYLAGILDGEGALKHRVLQISQSADKHPEVCSRIEWSLKTLGIGYSICDTPRRGGVQRSYNILGGRQEKIRILHFLGDLLAKKPQLVRQCFGSRNIGKGTRVPLVSQRGIGAIPVYNIQTETGNYIAGGFASKNCQMLQNPIADEAQGFREEWLSFYDVKPDYRGWHLYLLVDPASEKKKHNDFTAMWLVGLAPDQNYYLIDGIRDRLNLTERANKVFEFARRYPLKKVGYEKYGMMADVEHIRFRQSQDNFRFPIVELGGSMPKPDRIRRLIPLFENGRIYLPRRLLFRTTDGKTHDLIRELVDEEYKAFPVSVHDDLLDCLARIVEADLGANFPDLFNMRIGRDLDYRGETRNVTNHEYAVL